MSEIIVAMDHIHTVFDAKVVHDDISLTINRGEILGLVGGSGSGKTTLVREMIGLDMPTAGYVRLFNQRLDQLSEDDLGLMRQRCGVLFQSGALFSAFNVFDNIAFPLRESRLVDRRLIRDLVYMKLELAGLNAEVATLLPAALSGGMVKRVALARALALEPELLFLDEPTSGLDPVTAQTFVDHIAALHRELGFTAIVITHDLDLMHDLCTRLAILADRHIVALGAPSAVFPSRNPFVDTLFSGVRGQRVFGPGTLHE